MNGAMAAVMLSAAFAGAQKSGDAGPSSNLIHAGQLTALAEGVAFECGIKDLRNFEGYVAASPLTPLAAYVRWEISGGRSATILLDDKSESSRTLLSTSEGWYGPKAIGDDFPPPGVKRNWANVVDLLPHGRGGRVFMMSSGWAKDLLFEVPKGARLRFLMVKASVDGVEYTPACDLTPPVKP